MVDRYLTCESTLSRNDFGGNRSLILAFVQIFFLGCLGLENDSRDIEWVLTTRSGNGYSSLHFPTHDTGYVVGGDAVITKTVDGGKSWTEQHRETIVDILYDVHFFGASTGYAVGNKGQFLRTSNGGADWVSLKDSIRFDTTSGLSLGSVHFIGQTGYVLLNQVRNHRVLKTTNSGDSWTTVYADSKLVGGFFGLQFLTPETGYAAGRGLIKTVDGGKTWLQLLPDTSSVLLSVHFKNYDTGFVTGDDGIFKTSDGGNNWHKVFPTKGNLRLNDIDFMDGQVGYAVGEGIIRTTDGGSTWFNLGYQRPINHLGRATILTGIHCPDSFVCYAVADYGEIFKHSRR